MDLDVSGDPTPKPGQGTIVTGGAVTTVTADISGLLPGSTATLVLRLVNNDDDTRSTVRLPSGQADVPPAVAVDLEYDTAPEGPGAEPYRSDRLTNDPTIAGTATDDGGIELLEARVDAGPWQEITATLAGGRIRWTPAGLEPGSHRVEVRATDAAGQAAVAGTEFRLNAPPAARAGGDRTIDEGDVLVFDATGSTDAEEPLFSYRWTFADGSTAATPTVPRSYAQDGADVATLTVIDTAGSTAVDTARVTIRNRPPVLVPPAAAQIAANRPYELLAAFTDAGVLDRHAATIDWGDGTPPPAAVIQEQDGAGTLAATYAFAAAGRYMATIRLADDATPPGTATATAAIVVAATAPTVTIAGADRVAEGATYDLALSTREGDGGAITGWTIAWGDGAITTLAGNPTSAAHTYADGPNTYVITATAIDRDGAWSSNGLAVRVENVPPTLSIAGPAAVDEGVTYTLALGASDPGLDTIAGWAISWGDGTTTTPAGNPASATHTYRDGPKMRPCGIPARRSPMAASRWTLATPTRPGSSPTARRSG